VQTSEKWWIPLALVSSDPVFHFHWMDLTTIEATPVGIAAVRTSLVGESSVLRQAIGTRGRCLLRTSHLLPQDRPSL
jgi:hypothetical protein